MYFKLSQVLEDHVLSQWNMHFNVTTNKAWSSNLIIFHVLAFSNETIEQI